jgi:hypothetical protein
MSEEGTQRRAQVAAIKRGARSFNGGRSYLLQGLWACRQAAGLTQRQLAETIGSNQASIRVSEKATSRHLGGDHGTALAGDTRAEGEGFEPPRALARPPVGPPSANGTSLPKRLDPQTRGYFPDAL